MTPEPGSLDGLVLDALSAAYAPGGGAPASLAHGAVPPAPEAPYAGVPSRMAPSGAEAPAGTVPGAPVGSPQSDLDVTGLLAEAGAGGFGAPPGAGTSGAWPAATAVPASPLPPWLPRPPEAPAGGADEDRLLSAPGRAIEGDQQAIETMGRGFTRRDPVEGLDPLPKGRDAVTFNIGGISTKNEPSSHVPEILAFRASDDFPRHDQDPGGDPSSGTPPAVSYAPVWLANRAADAPAAAAFPAEPPREASRPRPVRPEAPATAAPAYGGAPTAAAGAPEASAAPLADRSVPLSPTSAPTGTEAHAAGAPHWLGADAHPGRYPTTHGSRGGSGAVHRPFHEGSGHALEGVRGDFPALQQKVHGRPLAWLDNGATTQKPRAVIDAVSTFYERDNSNVHRGAHTLAARATDAYEGARQKVQRYLGANSPDEIVFVRGATEAINLVAQAWGRDNLEAGHEIVVTHLEHHANLVPWQMLAQETGALLRVVPVDDAGNVRLDAYEAMLSPRVKLVALPQVSNAIGTVVPVGPMSVLAHRHGARVLVDGAQSAAHLPVDVSCLGADFFVLSGHKIYGPTGIGVLWARREILEAMPPWQGGGSMIEDVTLERTIYAEPPAKFEAGTPHLAGAVGLGVALEYVDAIGRPQIAAYEHMLLKQMLQGLGSVPGLAIVGDPMIRAAAVSFVMEGREPSEIAAHLDRRGIAVRAGHHCAQPILRRFGLEATVRASLGVYNVPSDIERLVDALRALATASDRRSRSEGPQLDPSVLPVL